MPAPKLLSSLPLVSNFMIGSSVDSAQANGAPSVIWFGGRPSPQPSAPHTPGASGVSPAAPGGPLSAAVRDPHAGAVGIDRDGAGRSPFAPVGQVAPVLDGAVGIGARIGRRGGLRVSKRREREECECGRGKLARHERPSMVLSSCAG